jgi:hypothetical protein
MQSDALDEFHYSEECESLTREAEAWIRES